MNVSQLTAHHVQQTTCRGLTPLLLLFLSILFFIHVYNFFFSSLLWLFYLFFFLHLFLQMFRYIIGLLLFFVRPQMQ